MELTDKKFQRKHMKTKNLISTLTLLLLCVLTASAQTNTLGIPNVTVAAGKQISLPVNLDNTADVVAVQFTLTVPQGITLKPSAAILTERVDGHSVTMRSIGSGKYMAMVFSGSNKPLVGRTGILMSVPLTAASWLDDGTELQLTMSDVVISAADGRNIVTGFNAGTVKIVKSPDLTVSAVNTSATTVNPGDKINVSWQVDNIGDLSTEAGWNEQIYLEGENGASKLLAVVYHESTLNAGEVVSRSAEFSLPEILGIDGKATIRVKLTPDSKAGEPLWLRDNNESASQSLMTVNKCLWLTPDTARIEEAENPTLRFYLSRSGDKSKDETFSLYATADGRIDLPESVTIAAGQSGVYFYGQMQANGMLDDNDAVGMALSGNGYAEVKAILNIEDDTFPSLYLTSSAQDVEEGNSLTFTVTAQRAPKTDLEIKLSCDFPTRFNIPSVVLPAGQTEVDVTVEAKENDVPNEEQVVTFSATVASYKAASMLVALVDNDIPTLQMTLTPNAVSEMAGLLAVTATLRRTDNIDKLVTVKFSDDSSGSIYYARKSVEMAAGVEEVTVNLGFIDNSVVDGERTYNVTAAVWIASCSCNAAVGSSGGVVTVPLTVYDNDGPTLALETGSSVVKEGDDVMMTISHNTETSSALTVRVLSDKDAYLEYPSSVTIPAGEASTAFTVKTLENKISGDSFTAVMTVEGEGFSKANAWFTVSDQTLPDARISAIEVSATEIEVGGEITVTATLTNSGSYELPELTKVGFYLSSVSEPLATAYLQAPLQVGESVTMSKTVSLPDAVGVYQVYAVANDGRVAKELLYTNNISASVVVKAVSPFAFLIKTDKAVYLRGETVSIMGSVQGNDIGGKSVDVYVMNDGYRHVMQTMIDTNGTFKVDYLPYDGQMGHFEVGACYPGEGLKEGMTSFDVYGLKRTTQAALTCKALIGEEYSGSFTVMNPGILPLSGLKVAVASKPDNCSVDVTCQNAVDGGATFDVAFRISPEAISEGDDWEHITFDVTTAEGASLQATLYYYCYNTKGELRTNVAEINTTMTEGVARDYPVTITNRGKGETGKITLAMPSWIKTVMGSEIPSLSQGDSAVVIFRFMPTDDMSLNVMKRGTIGINCENGSGLSLSYAVMPVSDSTGKLIVDVCDNYTYYTAEAPHLAGAEVVVKNPSTGAVVISGKTGDNGLFETTLPEGYYAICITADRHESYVNNIIIDPGKENRIKADLAIQTISIDWKVVETEVEDEYRIETVVNYEVNVPAPVVKITIPKSIDGDNMVVGENIVINMTLTNAGLITAQNNIVLLPQNLTEWKFEALAYNEPFDLAPGQSVNVPVRITRIADESRMRAAGRNAAETMFNIYGNCMAGLADRYEYMCGDKLSSNESAETMAMKFCATSATMGAIMDILGNVFSGGTSLPGVPGEDTYGDAPQNYLPIEYDDPNPELSFTICDPCDAARAEEILNTLIGWTGLGGFNDVLGDCIECYRMENIFNEFVFVIRKVGEDVIDAIRSAGLDETEEGLAMLVEYVEQVDGIVHACDDINQKKRASSGSRGWNEVFDEAATDFATQMEAADKILLMTFGDRIWYSDMSPSKYDFMEYAYNLEEGYIPTEKELMAVKPESVTLEQMYAYIRHLNGEGGNFLTAEALEEQLVIYAALESKAAEKGYVGMFECFEDILDGYTEHFRQMSSSESVCASISLKISQKMTMTRQAFNGTLTVFNGHETMAMENVRLKLDVRDEDGNQVGSHEMQMNAKTLDGFEGELGIDKAWMLGAKETGTAVIEFIPTKYAASIENRDYSFGGTLSYIDPFTGLEVTRALYPVTLTVKPSPNLNLTYFMQRDVMGDDPLTEAVEASEDAEFSLLINNVGYGDATNVRMLTNQPEIIDNEKGLKVDFELISSQLNGSDKLLALGGSLATDFGTVVAGGTAYAQWWLRSSLLGHFTEYNVNAVHLTSYENPDLSLLNEVTIHELIRSIEVTDGESKMVGFMTNDLPDEYDLPDMVYFSDGGTAPMAVSTDVGIVKVSDTDYELTVNPFETGWNYGNISDPTYGVVKLKRIVRQSDGKEMSLRNFWQTDRTLRDGKDPLYENRIHFVDDFADGASRTYTLTFEPMPEQTLEVASIEGIPSDDEIAYDHVVKVDVMFNKHVDPATFTVADISLNVQGKPQDVNLINIITDDNKTFTLDMTELNKTVGNGYYVLTVQTAGVTDIEGFNGNTSKSVGWNMYKDGLVLLNIGVSPVEAGTVSGNRNARYNEEISLTATSGEGYTFSHWMVNGVERGSETIMSHTAVADADIVAVFTRNTYTVEIGGDVEGGSITGFSTGIYSYGDELRLMAVPETGYKFSYWVIDGERKGDTPEMTMKVTSDVTVSAKFKYDGQYHWRLDLASGWNWISSYLSEPQPIDALLAESDRIVGQFDETVNDPELGPVGGIDKMEAGKAYKIEAMEDFFAEFTGLLHDLEDAPIVLKQGWNWIAYPYYETRGIASVITNAEEGDYIVSQYGFTEYADGYWEGSIEQLDAGYGYLYKSATDKTLAFDFDALSVKAMSAILDAAGTEDVRELDVHKYPNTMNITARLYRSDGSEITDSGYDIFAMSGNELRGIGKFVNGNYYITVYGDLPAEILFIIEHDGETYMADETLTFNGDIVGSRKAPYAITLGGTTGISVLSSESCNIVIYSVDGMLVKKNATLDDVKCLKKGVYIINGKKYLVK